MKNKFISFILAALSIASAFASGTVTAPSGNVAIDTSGPNRAVQLLVDITLDQRLSTADAPSFSGLSVYGNSAAGLAAFFLNSNVAGYGVLIGNGNDANYSFAVVNAANTALNITLFGDGSADFMGQLYGATVATNQLKVGSSPVAISQIRFGHTTMTAGVATISDATITTNTTIILTANQTAGPALRISTITAGVGFTVSSMYSLDLGTVNYLLIEP